VAVKHIPSPASEETLLTYQELAAVAKCSVAYIMKAKRELGLPFYNVSGVRFRLSEYWLWVEKRREQTKKQ